MNIITLLEKYNPNKGGLIQLSPQDFVGIIHQLEVEKITNPLLDKYVAARLIEALTNYKEEIQFLVNNQTLYGLFTNSNLPSDLFPKENSDVSNERVKSFISLFLEENTTLFFNQKFEENSFDDLNHLMKAQPYFPDSVLYNLKEKAYVKIDFAVEKLSVSNSDLSKILYLKQPSFYEFLSNFRSVETDEKLKVLLNRIVAFYSNNKESEFAGTSIISMYNYDPFETDFLAQIKKSRDDVYVSKSKSGFKTGSDFPWKTIVIGAVVLIRVVFFIAKWNSNTSHYNIPESSDDTIVIEQNEVMDPYYTNMKRKIDSFHVFLADYNKEEVQYIKYNDTIKSGENPFENLYKNPPTESNGNPIVFRNKTKYDIILLENPLAYDSIKMPGRAYFIKAGVDYKLDDVTTQLSRVFNFYIGKGLASFKTNSSNIFVRNHSVMEPRFSELLPNSKEILEEDYTFNSDVTIKEKKGKIEITSLEKQ